MGTDHLFHLVEVELYYSVSSRKSTCSFSEKVLVIITVGVMYLLVDTIAKLRELPDIASRKPHLPLPSITVDIVLGDAIIRVHSSLVWLFQHEWERTIRSILLVCFKEAKQLCQLLTYYSPYTFGCVTSERVQPQILALLLLVSQPSMGTRNPAALGRLNPPRLHSHPG